LGVIPLPPLRQAGLREVTLLLFFVHDNILSLRDLILPLDETSDGNRGKPTPSVFSFKDWDRMLRRPDIYLF